MRKLITFCVLLLAGTALFGQAATKPSLGLSVKPLSSGGAVKSDSSQSGNSATQTRTRTSQTRLEIQVRNFGRTPHTAQVEWYFLASAAGENKPFVSDKGAQEIKVEGGDLSKLEALSKELTAGTTKESTVAYRSSNGIIREDPARSSGSQSRFGFTAKGWLVRLTVEGKLVDLRASAPSLETLGRNEVELEKMRNQSPAGQ